MQYMENPSFHYAPEGYWDQENEKRKKHRFVGRKFGIMENWLNASGQQIHRQFSS